MLISSVMWWHVSRVNSTIKIMVDAISLNFMSQHRKPVPFSLNDVSNLEKRVCFSFKLKLLILLVYVCWMPQGDVAACHELHRWQPWLRTPCASCLGCPMWRQCRHLWAAAGRLLRVLCWHARTEEQDVQAIESLCEWLSFPHAKTWCPITSNFLVGNPTFKLKGLHLWWFSCFV